jgi:hypothetical protein
LWLLALKQRLLLLVHMLRRIKLDVMLVLVSEQLLFEGEKEHESSVELILLALIPAMDYVRPGQHYYGQLVQECPGLGNVAMGNTE